jgi:hypothetical protein
MLREHDEPQAVGWSWKGVRAIAAGANQVFKQKPWRSMAAAKHNKDRSGSESDARVARALKRDKVTVEIAFHGGCSWCRLTHCRVDAPGLRTAKGDLSTLCKAVRSPAELMS